MTEKMIEREYFECMCGGIDHTVTLSWIPDSKDPDGFYDDEMYFEMQLHRETRWWKRVWNAVKYVFGADYTSHWGECVVAKDEATRMRDLLDRYIKAATKESN